ncbi:MAG: alpha/beta fold hydrolase [Candidatus Nanopelagicales bacterium]
MTRLGGSTNTTDLLVVGPSLGTRVESLLGRCAHALADRFDVVGWDLPGHGRSQPASAPYTIADLADAVREESDRQAGTRPAWYAGVSIAGLVGFQLGLDPGPFRAVATLASAPRIGSVESWQERAAQVRRAGMQSLVAASAVRWFAPGFLDREPRTAGRLLAQLSDTDSPSYAWPCDALAVCDLRPRLGDTKVPLLVAAGEQDQVFTPQAIRAATEAAPDMTFEVVAGCGHLPPVEDATAVAAMLSLYFPEHGDFE